MFLEQYRAARRAWRRCKPGTIAQADAWVVMIRAFLRLSDGQQDAALRHKNDAEAV